MRWLVMLVMLFACGGPSGAALHGARYDAERAEVFRLAREAVATKRTIASEDAPAFTFRTGPEDIEISMANGSRAKHRASFVITVAGERPWQIDVRGIIEGDDTAPTPSFLQPFADRIRADIHARLKAYAR